MRNLWGTISIILFLVILSGGCLIQKTDYNGSAVALPVGHPSSAAVPTSSPGTIPSESPAISSTRSTPNGSLASSEQLFCEDVLMHPEYLISTLPVACPDLPPEKETYAPEDPAHLTEKDYESIPWEFSGIGDRKGFIRNAVSNPCVQAFLLGGGEIMMVSGQYHTTPSNYTGDTWPPALYAYKRINCTDMIVQFDLDSDAKNVTRITITLNSFAGNGSLDNSRSFFISPDTKSRMDGNETTGKSSVTDPPKYALVQPG